MYHVNGSYNQTRATFIVVKGKGPVSEWAAGTIEAAQDLAKFACRMALIYGYSVTLDLGPDTDDLLTFHPGCAFHSTTIDHSIGSFSWQSKGV